MKKIVIATLACVLSFASIAQDVTLKFSGSTTEGQYVKLDSVKVENKTRSWSEILSYPDTVLSLTSSGIVESSAHGTSLACYPNPFDGRTMVSLSIEQQGEVCLQLYNANGQLVVSKAQDLDAGTHFFQISVDAAQVYFLTAQTSQGRCSVKLISQGKTGQNGISMAGTSSVSLKKISDKPFKVGDKLNIVGYTTYKGKVVTSKPRSQNQSESEEMVLFFAFEMPVVNTDSVYNVTNMTAEVAADVVSDGGSSVFSRGICWSTSPNPTTKDYHFANGTGLGSFFCKITGLSIGTTYYVRAYATNDAGTAYGRELSFTTINQSFVCGTDKVKDYDGNNYATVKMGKQCWTKENLRTTHYADGTKITLGVASSTKSPFCYYPGENEMNVTAYGMLYNWPAVMHGAKSSNTNPSRVQGVCPNGWHVPSKSELEQMLKYVASQEEFLCDDDTLNIAKALAANVAWAPYSDFMAEQCCVGYNVSTNNSTGFSLKPAGIYYQTNCRNMTSHAYLWTTTEEVGSDNAYYSFTSNSSTGVSLFALSKSLGVSVRCVSDELITDSVVFECGISSVQDYDGNKYSTIRIGNQCWVKENLRSEHYADGRAIATGTTLSADSALRYAPDNDKSKVAVYGYLYNWMAVMDGEEGSAVNPSGVQGICPEGWHLPSEAEWSQLEQYMSKQSQYTCDNAYNIAKALASTTGWKTVTETGTADYNCLPGVNSGSNNKSGFNALPAGTYSGKEKTEFGETAYFWSTDDNSSFASYSSLSYNTAYLTKNTLKKSLAMSVRCLRK